MLLSINKWKFSIRLTFPSSLSLACFDQLLVDLACKTAALSSVKSTTRGERMETKKAKKVRKVKKKTKSLIKANMTAEEKAEFRNSNLQLEYLYIYNIDILKRDLIDYLYTYIVILYIGKKKTETTEEWRMLRIRFVLSMLIGITWIKILLIVVFIYNIRLQSKETHFFSKQVKRFSLLNIYLYFHTSKDTFFPEATKKCFPFIQLYNIFLYFHTFTLGKMIFSWMK